MKEVISSFIICYAIGYMLFARPFFIKKNWDKITDKLFYGSLVMASIYKFIA